MDAAVAKRHYRAHLADVIARAEYRLEAPTKTRMWELRAQAQEFNLTSAEAVDLAGPVILVKHDWHAVCSLIDGYDATAFQFPFDHFNVELRIGTVTAVVSLWDRSGDETQFGCVFAAERDDSFTPITAFSVADGIPILDHANLRREPWMGRLAKLALDQVRAMSVLLESDLAEASEIIAPAKLQKARAKRGTPPINSYLELALKRHSKSLSQQIAYQGVVRCHFRRGHWMHVGDRKVWRKWTIVGNPDLGFVDKTYVLGMGGAS